MPLPLTVSCFSKIPIGFTFLVPAHPGSPGQRAVKRVCVCKQVIAPGRRNDMPPPRRRQFDSRRIYVRLRTGPQSAHGLAAGSQRVYKRVTNIRISAHFTHLRKFRSFVFATEVTIFSDHNPLVYLRECASKSAKFARWAPGLQEFVHADSNIVYTSV